MTSESDIYQVSGLPAATSIYEINPLVDSRWEAFARRHPRASVFHSTSWLRTLNSAYGYEIAALTTAAPRDRIENGLVFCRIRSRLTGNRSVSLPFSDHCEPLVDRSDDLDAMLFHLRTATDATKGLHVEIRPLVTKPNGATGFRKSNAYALHSIDLSASSEAIYRTFHKDCVQRKIKRAERESLVYESNSSEDLLKTFYRLIVATRRRHGLVPQPLTWFRHLSHWFGDRMQVRVAFHRNQPVAGMLTLKHGSTITYKYGCSDARFNNLGGTALLFWRTILESKEERITRFDLGRSDFDNEGLIKFKEHWGATRALLEYWRYPNDPLSRRRQSAEKLMAMLVAICPDWSLMVAGSVLYPHLG